ncbi:MAG: DUF6518 family protein [Mycetocola sp.]
MHDPEVVSTVRGQQTSRRITGAVLSAVGGGIAGVLAKFADGAGTWAADLTSYLAIWVVAVALIGAYAPTATQAAVRSVAAAVTMCAGYYAITAFVLHYPVGREAAVWLVLAVTAVPVCAALICRARSADRWWSAILIGLCAALCVSDGAVSRVVMMLTEDTSATFDASVRPVQAVVSLLGVVVIVGCVPRSWRNRVGAALVAGVAGVVALPVVAELRSLIGV